MTSDSITSLPLIAQPLPGQENGRDGSATLKVAGLQHPRHAADTSVDWSLVAALRAQASEQLSQALAANRGRLDKAAQEELGRSIVLDLIESTVAERVNAGGTTPTVTEHHAMARAVFDSLFRLGRLQPLVDDDRIENIIIAGHDNVMLELIDGSLHRRPACGRLR